MKPFFEITPKFGELIGILSMMSLLGKLFSGLLMMCDAGPEQLPLLAIRVAQLRTLHSQCVDRFTTARFSDMDLQFQIS